MREVLWVDPWVDLRTNISENRTNSQQYLVPIVSEVATIMPRHGDDTYIDHRDVQIYTYNC